MARLRKLAAKFSLLTSIVIVSPICKSEGTTMAANAAYVFTEIGTDCDLQVALGSSNEYTVTVTMKRQGMRFRSEQQLQVPSISEQAQALLKSPPRLDVALATMTLRDERSGTSVSWSPATETDSLRNFREQVEKAVNTHFITGYSYLLSGRLAKTSGEMTRLYKAGLQAVGTSYRDTSVQDDTGLKLIAAGSLERTQGPGAAAPMLERVLENRLRVWAKRDHLDEVSQVR